MRNLTFAAVAFLLAGCSHPASPSNDPELPHAATDAARIQQSIPLLLGPAPDRVPVSVGLADQNCVQLRGDSFQVNNGTVSLSWTGGPPAMNEFNLAVIAGQGEYRNDTGFGPSPRQVNLNDLPPGTRQAAVLFVIQLPTPNLFVMQETLVSLDVAVAGEVEVWPDGKCVFAPPT